MLSRDISLRKYYQKIIHVVLPIILYIMLHAVSTTQRFKYLAARIDCRLRLVTWQVACGRCGRWQLWQEAH